MYTDVKSALEAAEKAQTLEELMNVVRSTSAQAEGGKSQPELTKIVMELETNPNL